MSKTHLPRLIKLNRVIAWLLVVISALVLALGYVQTILNVESNMITRGHYVMGGVFALFFILHMSLSVVLIRYDWRTTLRKILNRGLGSLSWLRFAQRVSGWALVAAALLVLVSGLDWFKIGTGWLLPFAYHVRFDLFLLLSIIIHVSIGLKFSLMRRRIRRKDIEQMDGISLARREAIIVMAGMFLSLMAAFYLEKVPRARVIADKIQRITGILPPGQYEVGKLRMLHVGAIPPFDENSWTLEVYGLVKKPLILSYAEIKELTRVISISDFHCVTGWSKFQNKWEGVQFNTIMQQAKPFENARFATIECEGSYTTSLPLEELVMEDVVLAYRLDDRELPPEHGGPLRIVVPHKYGYKSAKWVRKIKFTEDQELGYWESQGYSNTADPFTNDRFSG